jgi:hypothetical protein
MWRVVIALMIGGGALCFFGHKEYRVSAGTSSEPMSVELADIEGGEISDNNYIQIGPHYRLFEACVYGYETSSGSEKVTNRTKVTEAYYPVYSVGSSFGRQMGAMTKKYGGYDEAPDDLPDNERLPLDNVAMLIKTSKYRTVGKLPGGVKLSQKITGLVINTIESIGSEEKKLLQEGFGNIDFSKVLILEQGRKPTSAIASLGMMGGGALLVLAPLIVGFARGRSKSRDRTHTASEPQPAASPLDAVVEPAQMVSPPPISPGSDNNPYSRTD